jgi:uncharacterized membrane protein
MNFIDDKWLDIYYTEVGREIGVASSQLHDTTNWSIGITTAAVSAIALSGQPYPQVWTLGLAVVAFILLIRIFLRTCLAYANLTKWNEIHTLITRYKLADNSSERQHLKNKILRSIELYHLGWQSPKPIHSILWSNLKLGYLYMFLILGFLCVWGFIQAQWNHWPTWMLLIFWGASIIYEVMIFPRKTYLYYTPIDATSNDESKK